MIQQVFWNTSKLSKSDREKLKGHRGMCIWFTGLPGSGKSTLANELESMLYQEGIHTYYMDGDNIRYGLNSDLGFTADDRKENIRRIGEVVKLFVDAGIVIITAFVSPYKSDRDFVRSLISESFIEVYVECELETCEMRDPKGLYKKARNNEITDFTGISAPYDIPENPEIVIYNGNGMNSARNSKLILNYLQKTLLYG